MLQLHPPLSLSSLEENMVSIEGGVMEIQGVNIQLENFELCRYPVSHQLWIDVMGYHPKKIEFKNLHRPVERVSWNDIRDEFLPALREETRDDSWYLPTEAQWEYAARGGKYARAYTYAGSEQLIEVGWYKDNSFRETNPSACKRPNTLGLHDMSGNVREWCQDWYDVSYYRTLKDQYGNQLIPNQGGAKDGISRVVRGRSWLNSPNVPPVSYRNLGSPFNRLNDVGFRLCRYSAR